MTNFTVRNIPEEVMGGIRSSAAINRRSINNEILVILERNMDNNSKINNDFQAREISKQAKLDIWSRVCGQWQDDRSTQEIIDDIYQARSLGRDIDL